MIEEIWKDIEWYGWLYQISNLWSVRSLNYNKIRILKLNSSGKPYKKIMLSLKQDRKTYAVHRLVATYFIENPNSYPFVCHKIENLDINWFLYNWYNNLYWWTASDNVIDMWKKWRAKNHLQINHPKGNLWKKRIATESGFKYI